MTLITAWRDGWVRVVRAPAIVAGVFVMTFLLALPLVLSMRELIRAHLGSSLAATAVANGQVHGWWQEFLAQASGLGATLVPTIIGFASTLDNLRSILDARLNWLPVALAVGVYLAGWLFLIGGVIDRYARRRPACADGFFSAAGVYFFRLARLGVIAGAIYWWLFAYVHAWLFGSLYVRLTRDLAVEREAFFVRALLYALFGALLIVTNVVFDYAKVRLVVEDRRSVVGSMTGALRFIGRHPWRVSALYSLNALSFVTLLALWAVAAPGVTDSGAARWLAFLLTQAYVLARLLLKLQFLASQVALFRG